jgi:hypothetical protein
MTRGQVTRNGREVAVLGVALSDCGRVDDATPYALHAQAARRALADSGLPRSAVDGFASAGLGTLAPVEVAEYLGLRPRWVDSTSVGGATWEVMAAHAADAIAAGHANAVLLAYGSTARADVRAGAVTVVAELTNVGAGHYLPTTTTPAAWLTITLIDAAGAPIEGASSYVRIGRDLTFDGRWHEREDTRIPPGETLTMARAWSGGRTAAAVSAKVRVIVSPDDYYEHLYERRLAGPLPAARRALYEQALARARKDHYTALDRVVPIAR